MKLKYRKNRRQAFPPTAFVIANVLPVYIANGYYLVMSAVNGLGGRNRLQCPVTAKGPQQNKITITDCICFEHDILLRV
jgi:hypothetical protein